MRLEGSDPIRYIEGELEADPTQWDSALSRKRLFQSALLAGIGGSALLGAARAEAAPQRVAGAARTTLVAAQRVTAPTLNVDVPGFRSEILLSCYPGVVDIDIPANYDEARKLLSAKGPTIAPELARTWKTNKAQTVWTFDLQPNAKSFYGNNLTALSMQWSADKWTVGSTYVANLLSRLAGITSSKQVTALTPERVRLTFASTPPPFLLGLLSSPWLAVYDAEEIKKHVTAGDPWGNNWLRSNTAGFGPYQVQSNSPTGDQQVFVVNPGYWNRPSNPKLTRITRLAIPENSTRLQLLLANQAHLADELTAVELQRVQQSKDHRVTVYATARTMFVAMDNSKSPFDNPTIRRGIARVVPYDDILKFAYRGFAKRWKTMIVPYFPGATDKYWAYETNLNVARTLLEPIKNVPLTLNYPIGSPADEQVAILVQQGLRAAGLTVNLEALDGQIYNVRKNTGQLQFYTNAQDTPIVADPVYDVNRFFYSKALQPNIIKFQYRKDVDDLIAAANSETDLKRLISLLDQVQKIVVPLVPMVPIAWTGNQTAHHKDLKGIRSHAFTLAYYQDLFWA